MQLGKIILSPTISPNRITISDIEGPNSGIKFSKELGQDSPLLKINGIPYFGPMIINMELSIDRFVPYINVVLSSNDGLFDDNYPVDGDIVSVYIKSKHKDFKSIVMDFRITSITSPISADDRSYSSNVSISGVMDLRELYKNHISSYEGNTLTVLKSICKELGLGLVSNSESFNDEMVHLCTLVDYKEFLKNIISTSYKSDGSFFTGFVDQYYNLNLIDIESIISNPMEMPELTYHETHRTDYIYDDTSTTNSIKLALSNSKVFFGTPYHISGYSLFNNTATSMKDGYRQYLSYRNENSKEVVEYFIDPIFNDEDSIVTRGRPEEDHTTQIKYQFKGYQFNDNVHDNYYFAKHHNIINNHEVRKLGLMVDLKEINPVIFRGMGINVFIYNKPNQGDTTNETLNDFFSGYYYVDGIKYLYSRSNNRFNMRLKLIKREWTK